MKSPWRGTVHFLHEHGVYHCCILSAWFQVHVVCIVRPDFVFCSGVASEPRNGEEGEDDLHQQWNASCKFLMVHTVHSGILFFGVFVQCICFSIKLQPQNVCMLLKRYCSTVDLTIGSG